MPQQDRNPLALYVQFHLDRSDDRIDLFRLLSKRFSIRTALYPGCFVHLTPALIFPFTMFVDVDRRAQRFFSHPAVSEYIAENREYAQAPEFTFQRTDYTQDLTVPVENFDLLISSYAGFISEHCTRYLKIGGILLANNSHGDASLASIDPRYTLAAVANRRNNRFTLSEKKLDEYLIPKQGIMPKREELLAAGRGITFSRSASFYMFQRVT